MTYSLNIRSYLGVPIFYRDGEIFGTLCAVDSRPSNFTPEDISTLQNVANLFTYILELEQMSYHDSLTKLYNRTYLYNNFEVFTGEGIIMLLDLDGFKLVNDKFGHDIGDVLLKEVGTRIKKFISSKDKGIRLGGDEFVIIFHGLNELETIKKTGSNILRLLSDWQEFKYDIQVSASVGIVKFPQGGTDLRTILKKADLAMYRAKNKGKNAFHLFDSETKKA